MLDIQ